MPKNVVNPLNMQVGAKGGGRHWTKKEVESRQQAAQAFKRDKISLTMPLWLDDAARKIWKKTLQEMMGFEILDNVDADSLAIYCDAVARYQELTLKIREHGYTTTNATGTETVSPYVRASQSYSRIVIQYADKLGLNANARARLAKKTADSEDESKSMFGD